MPGLLEQLFRINAYVEINSSKRIQGALALFKEQYNKVHLKGSLEQPSKDLPKVYECVNCKLKIKLKCDEI